MSNLQVHACEAAHLRVWNGRNTLCSSMHCTVMAAAELSLQKCCGEQQLHSPNLATVRQS